MGPSNKTMNTFEKVQYAQFLTKLASAASYGDPGFEDSATNWLGTNLGSAVVPVLGGMAGNMVSKKFIYPDRPVKLSDGALGWARQTGGGLLGAAGGGILGGAAGATTGGAALALLAALTGKKKEDILNAAAGGSIMGAPIGAGLGVLGGGLYGTYRGAKRDLRKHLEKTERKPAEKKEE